MKIYTKTGDGGKTSLVEGTRISKAHLRIESYGSVDELNAVLGIVSDQEVNADRRPFLKQIQDNLFVIGSNLASDPAKRTNKVPPVHGEEVEMLEKAMDEMQDKLPVLKHFILPGGHVSVSYAHLARTVCRRAERVVSRLSETEDVPILVLVYLNRLSDYFFVLSRMMAQELSVPEVIWDPKKK